MRIDKRSKMPVLEKPRCRFWASTHSGVIDRHAVEEIRAVIAPSKLKLDPGNVIFEVEYDRLDIALALALASLNLVEYIYFSLISYSSESSMLSMPEITSSVKALPAAIFDRAIKFWMLFGEATNNSAVSKTEAIIKFRVVSRRGGAKHPFTSRHLKRLVANCISDSQETLEACFEDYQFDLLARVHSQDFSLGLQLNIQPLFSAQPGHALPPVNGHSTRCRRYRLILAYSGKFFSGWQKQRPKNGVSVRTIEEELELILRPLVRQKLRFHPSGRTDAGVSATGQVCQFDAVSDDNAGMLTLHLPQHHVSAKAAPASPAKVFETLKMALPLEPPPPPPAPLTPPPAATTSVAVQVEVASLAAAFNAVLPTDIRVVDVSVIPKAESFTAMDTEWKRYSYTLPPCGPALREFCIRYLVDGGGAEGASISADTLAHMAHPQLSKMNDTARDLLGPHDFAGFQTKGNG